MAKGSVYLWEPSQEEFTGGRLTLDTVELPHLWSDKDNVGGLSGRYVDVMNIQKVFRLDRSSSFVSAEVGNAAPDPSGDFIYDPSSGGHRLDSTSWSDERRTDAIVSASHFGEVNVYWHITALAERVEKLLLQLGERPLPRIRAVVGARATHAATGSTSGLRRRRPVEGAKYHFPAALAPELRPRFNGTLGEIALGAGTNSTKEGWLPRLADAPYLCNPSHIAGFIYHAYGQHIVRHTADNQANDFRAPERQKIEEDALGDALGKFWAASMLSSPYIWSWHCRHDPEYVYPDNLGTAARMQDFDDPGSRSPGHAASVLAAALWDLKSALGDLSLHTSELLVLSALTNLRRLRNDPYRPERNPTKALRSDLPAFAACLLHADATRFGSKNSELLKEIMKQRGIDICKEALRQLEAPLAPRMSVCLGSPEVEAHVAKILERFPEAIIPQDDEFVHPDELEFHLARSADGPYDVAAVGDVMTGMRMRHRIRKFGQEYPFAWVRPIFRRSATVAGNLEGPFAEIQEQAETTRNYSYKVDPRLASVLRRGGFNAMTIANNHIMDCGREGVLETLDTLKRQRIEVVGGGESEAAAHEPAIFASGATRIGFLGYYWNKRTAAQGALAGSARDLPELVERDCKRLRKRVDRIVVMVHWGVPYERQPLDEDRAKARHFVDCGADAVIGHHPHIIQPMEIYKNRPILYSVGNFAFGSGNSKAESLLPCIRFASAGIEMDIYPVYVQNRDLRLDYQPKIIRGRVAQETLKRLELCPTAGVEVDTRDFHCRVRIAD